LILFFIVLILRAAGIAMEGEEHLLTSPGTSTLEALIRLATVA
jgi:hypothetical protein